MKNLTYNILLAAIIALPAHAIASELSLGVANNQKFILAFDNSFYNTPSNTYNVTNIAPGNHHLRMTSAPVGMNGACGMPQLLFDGWVSVPQNARVTAIALNYSQLNIVSVVPLQTYPYGYNNPYGNPYGNNGYGNYGNNGYGNGNGCGNGNGYNNGYGNNNGYGYGNPSSYPDNNYGYGNNYPPATYGMSQIDFSALKNSINAQSFDSSKLTIAKQGIASNNLTAAQVKELIGLMTFESNKLDLAKFAYGHTVDRNNYYQVNDAFTFSSSVDELSQYINAYHA